MRLKLSSKDIESKIINVMCSVFNIDKTKINKDMNNENTDGWDSLKHMNLIIALEEEFNLSFDDSEIVKINSLKKINEVISKKKL